MQLTRQTEYSIRTLIELANAPEGVMSHSSTIAEKLNLPEMFLKKTVQLLVQAGLVETRRGMGGGMRLAVSPNNVTLADILSAIEGKLAINPCLRGVYHCEDQSVCPVRKVLQRTQGAILTELSKETLADLAKGEVVSE
jgi:Rrf2 family transcriptional regulator, nitric oxide-sensitive transcriptional repressor